MQYHGELIALTFGLGFVVAQILYMVQAVLLKWIVLGRSVPGRYHAHSAYGLRFALVHMWLTAPLSRVFCVLFADTYISKIVLVALGAKMGRHVIINRLSPMMLAGADKLHLGTQVALSYDCAVLGAVLSGDVLIIAPVYVHSR